MHDEVIQRTAGDTLAGRHRSSSPCLVASRCRAAALGASGFLSRWADPRCSMLRDSRWADQAIWTATASDAVFTVRAYVTSQGGRRLIRKVAYLRPQFRSSRSRAFQRPSVVDKVMARGRACRFWVEPVARQNQPKVCLLTRIDYLMSYVFTW